jgi:4'-phosphopantetheinyl transferase
MMGALPLTPPPLPASVERSWAPGSPRAPLADGALHVWRADLEALSDDLAALLCREERARAERILRERDRQLWKRTHGLLRRLLGNYLGTDPRTLCFTTGAHGKPALLGGAPGSRTGAQSVPPRPSRLSFNLSHSGHLALYAFSAIGAVGVDVELPRRPIDEVAIAARTFGWAEARRLEGLEPAVREGEFLRTWVRAEAKLKCLGTGIGGGASEGAREREPWIAELEVGPRAAAAVAVQGSPHELRFFAYEVG